MDEKIAFTCLVESSIAVMGVGSCTKQRNHEAHIMSNENTAVQKRKKKQICTQN